jgi:murein DD-endopeptidase
MSREVFIQACLHYLSLPYKWGGDDPIKGYDCSGLVQELLAMVGVDPAGDQTAQALYDHFKSRSKEGSRDTGALVFYGRSLTQITHVAMIIENQTIIEAGGGGSKTVDLESAALQNAYVRLRSFNHRKDVLAVLMPKELPWA